MKEAYLAQEKFEVKALDLQHEMKEAEGHTKENREELVGLKIVIFTRELQVEASNAFDTLMKLMTAKLNASSKEQERLRNI